VRLEPAVGTAPAALPVQWHWQWHWQSQAEWPSESRHWQLTARLYHWHVRVTPVPVPCHVTASVTLHQKYSSSRFNLKHSSNPQLVLALAKYQY
jgi:hypothetical protein